MTLEELRDRIKNEVVLYEGELADWQWRQKGLVAEANELGITDFTRLVNDISRQVNRDFGKILDLKKKIVTVALQRRKNLSEADIDQFVTEAERVQLSKAFVTGQWIPSILAELPSSLVTSELVPPSGSLDTDPISTVTKPQNQPVPEPAPAVEKVESVRKKIKSILDDYDKHIQAQSLKFLFKAVDYDEAALAEEIRLYLSEHYYASVNPPRGTTLREKLISTDWRHLSWWEKEQPKPNPESAEYVKTQTGYTTTPAAGNVNQSNQPPVVPWPSPDNRQQILPPPVKPPDDPPKSGLSDVALIGLAILSALVLIWVVLRMMRGEDSEPVQKGSKKRTSQHLDPYQNPKASVALPAKSKTKNAVLGEESAPDETKSFKLQDNIPGKQVENQPAPDAKTVAEHFDQVDENVGEFGWRPAQKGKRWGYIDETDKWTIEPQFDLATPFNNGKASVELDGNQFFIDRYGNRIRDDN